MKVMCNQCDRVMDLMTATTFAVEEEGQLRTYNFCSEEHLKLFAQREVLPLSKD